LEFSEYRYTRSLLDSSVISLVRDFNLILYGSFLTKCFHLPFSMDYSFSDVDLVAEFKLDHNERIEIEKSIKTHLFDQFGINFRVSIRNQRIHQDSLENQVSYAVSLLETLLKLMDKPLNKEHSHYQLAKVYLRIVHRNSYFKNGINFDRGSHYGEISGKCCQIKTKGGFFTSQEIISCIKEIERVSSSIGEDIKSIIDSGVLIEDIFRRHSSPLIANNAIELIDDLRSKMDLAKKADNQTSWDTEKLRPLF